MQKYHWVIIGFLAILLALIIVKVQDNKSRNIVVTIDERESGYIATWDDPSEEADFFRLVISTKEYHTLPREENPLLYTEHKKILVVEADVHNWYDICLKKDSCDTVTVQVTALKQISDQVDGKKELKKLRTSKIVGIPTS